MNRFPRKHVLLPITILLCLFLFLIHCNGNYDRAKNFQREESESIRKSIVEILNFLKYDSYQILVIPHRSYSETRVSERRSFESFSGSAMQGFDGTSDFQLPPGYNSKDTNSRYSKRDFMANYDPSKRDLSYYVDYFSILILFDTIGLKDKEKLVKLLERTVLHQERGDVLEIVSKEKP
ncbi:hypothetical protein [Leptospira barantonii]|uniref:Lipoprotein n=1 Tax=Leptospira barantonii TaxID=2023184 RepID=A0ABX4NNS4_9LEPT|nr:hypothetical protein [Leptospira barantonii]PJZ58388.1 hypothetical protein CH367_08505 [Leptospira barantonii]